MRVGLKAVTLSMGVLGIIFGAETQAAARGLANHNKISPPGPCVPQTRNGKIVSPCGAPADDAKRPVSIPAPATNIHASRVYAGPGEYPPSSFKAYGIIAFPTRVTPDNRARFLMICQKYQAGLVHTSELRPVPTSQQMVTVWPLEKDKQSSYLNEKPNDPNTCPFAVDHYGLGMSVKALREAGLSANEQARGGPFLIAWSPAIDKGRKPSLVLKFDLSSLKSADAVGAKFVQWREKIEANPRTWENGWNVRVIDGLRDFFDTNGTLLLTVVRQ